MNSSPSTVEKPRGVPIPSVSRNRMESFDRPETRHEMKDKDLDFGIWELDASAQYNPTPLPILLRLPKSYSFRHAI